MYLEHNYNIQKCFVIQTNDTNNLIFLCKRTAESKPLWALSASYKRNVSTCDEDMEMRISLETRKRFLDDSGGLINFSKYLLEPKPKTTSKIANNMEITSWSTVFYVSTNQSDAEQISSIIVENRKCEENYHLRKFAKHNRLIWRLLLYHTEQRRLWWRSGKIC